MPDAITAKQIFDRLQPYDLARVTFRTPDGLPILAACIDTDTQGGAIVILSDAPTQSA